MNYAFSNYTEFSNLFGVNEHGNGEKSRRNKILLSLYKSKNILHYMATHSQIEESYINYYGCNDMTTLYSSVLEWLQSESKHNDDARNRIILNGIDVYSVRYELDDFDGICEDGDTRSIRYINTERGRVFKMRAGKFLRNLIEENPNLNATLPEQIKIWVCEEFAERWKAYAAEHITHDKYTLYVNSNFEDIYDSYRCAGDFGSCMVNDGYWTFYRDSVSAKAAYLENEDGDIVARCIIYTDVIDGAGNHLRLAERQYASGGDDSLKRMLVMRLIEGKHIDGYKKVGADCHSPKAFVDIHGNTLPNLNLHIDCDLYHYDVVSYQDSFKFYDEDEQIAYNSGDYENLCNTDGTIDREDEDDHENDRWSDYNEEWIYEDDAYYVDSRDDYFYSSQVRYAYRQSSYGRWYQEDCFEDDVIKINGEYYYAGYNAEDWYSEGIRECDECGEYFVPDREESSYSDLTEKWYCDEYCKNDAEESYKEDHNVLYDDVEDVDFDADRYEYVRILVYDWQNRKRINGYTKRENLGCSRNLINYKGNWYFENVDMDARMPREKMQKDIFAA